MKASNLVLSVLAAALFCAQASAHAVIERNEAVAGSFFKLVLAITHGCEGSPTRSVRIRIPEGVLSVKPQPKAGWELAAERRTLPNPVKGPHGITFTEAVTEVTWTGKLPDEYFDEFVMQVALPAVPGTLYFPTVQECDRGAHRWTQVPAAGQDAHALDHPAPSLKVGPAHHAH